MIHSIIQAVIHSIIQAVIHSIIQAVIHSIHHEIFFFHKIDPSSVEMKFLICKRMAMMFFLNLVLLLIFI